jgi:hypothetical protein
MNPLTELHRQIHSLQLLQLLLLFVFVIAYLTTIGRVWGTRGRLRAAAVGALAAIGLCVAIDPWTVGALVIAGAVGSVGLFVLATMFVWRALGEVDAVMHVQRVATALPLPVADRRVVRSTAAGTVTVG